MSEPCPICCGNGTRGQAHGAKMVIVECEVCGGSGNLTALNKTEAAPNKIVAGLRDAIEYAKEQNAMTDKAEAAFQEWNLRTQAPHRTLRNAYLAGRAGAKMQEATDEEIRKALLIWSATPCRIEDEPSVLRTELARLGLRVVRVG